MDDVKKLRELLANASPGPWFVSNERRCIDAGFVGDDGAIYDGPSYGPLDQNDPKWTADAALIAAAVNALPALLDEVERLRRVEVAANSVEFGEARIGGWQVYRHARGEGWTCFYPFGHGYLRDEDGNVRRFASLVEAVIAIREADKPALPASALGGEG